MANIHLKPFLKLSAKISGLCLLGVCLLVALLPTLCSSPMVQGKMKPILSRAMGRQVSWSTLSAGWHDGLKLSGLKLGKGPAPLLSAGVGQVEVAPSVGRDATGRFGVGVAVRVRGIDAELAPGPPSPPQPPSTKDPLTRLVETLQSIQTFDLPLPVDVRLTVDVEQVAVRYRTAEPERQVGLKEFSLHLAMPSLSTKPVTATVAGMVSVNGRSRGTVECSAMIRNLVSAARRVNLSVAEFAVTTMLPGATISLTGGLRRSEGVVTHGSFNLPALQAVLSPFLSPHSPKVGGDLGITLRAKMDDQQNVQASVQCDGTALSVTDQWPQSEPVGPFNVSLQQRVTTSQRGERVDFPDGRLQLPGLLDMFWHASVDHPTASGRSLEVTVGPVKLDVGGVYALLEPLLPPSLPVTDIAGELSLSSLQLRLAGTENRGNLVIRELAVALPRLQLHTDTGSLDADDLFVSIDSGTFPLRAALPVRGDAVLRWGVRQALRSGKEPLTLKGAGGEMTLGATDLDLKSSSPRHVAATVALSQKFDLESGSFGTLGAVQKFHEQLRLAVRANAQGDLSADLPECELTAASLLVNTPGKKMVPVPFSVSFNAAGFNLSAAKGAQPTVQRVTADIGAGDAVRLTGEGSRPLQTPGAITAHGAVQVDLKRLFPVIAPFVPVGLGGEGRVTAEWNLAAPVTETVPASGNNPLQKVRDILAKFDSVTWGVTLDSVSASIPTSKGVVRVSGVQTASPLRFASSRTGERITIDGKVLFDGLSGLVGSGGEMAPQHGMVRMGGELRGWKELYLNEEVRMEPFVVQQEGELNVSRIDSLFDEKEPFTPATLARRLDAILFATFDGKFSSALKPLLPGLDLAGHAAGNLRVDLNGGRDVGFGCAVKTDDFGVRLANGTAVEGIHADVVINRVYGLARVAEKENWLPLSASLVRPSPASLAPVGAADIIGRIKNDLHGDVSGSRSFTVRRVLTKVSGVPLELTSLEGDLLFTREKTGLGFFQADLLGGTVLAHGVVDLVPEIPTVSASSSFSHLDISRMQVKQQGKKTNNEDAEISGEVGLTAPLTPEQRDLFEQLRLAVTIRKIGANTLEQALYALDPNERNEQMVAQRKLLRIGSLKGLRAVAVDGAFSIEGEALVKGAPVDLPKVDRLRISELPLRQDLAAQRGSIMSLRSILDLVRADTLVFGQHGEVTLKRRGYAQ